MSVKSIKAYLPRQASYSLHKPSRKNFNKKQTVVGGIDQQWQADLADMQALSRNNKEIKYILTGIDIVFQYARAIPVKNNCGSDMKNDVELLFQMSHPRKLDKLQTDAGKQFLNNEV